MSFASELSSWREIVKTHIRWTIVAGLALLLSATSFFLSLSQVRSFSQQFSFLESPFEILLEVDGRVREQERVSLQDELKALPMVKAIDFWSPDQSRDFIDQTLLPGYSGFLQKTGGDIPVPPLFRVQLTDLKAQESFLSLVSERYGDRLSILTMSPKLDDHFFTSPFLASLQALKARAVTLTVLNFFIFLALLILVASRFFHERTRTWSELVLDRFSWFPWKGKK